ncbi:hypothetical protein LINPERPRIM_LOCUS22304 [Linum perenne]
MLSSLDQTSTLRFSCLFKGGKLNAAFGREDILASKRRKFISAEWYGG